LELGDEKSIWLEAGREAELLVAAQAGDRDTFLELARAYQAPLYRLAFSMTQSKDDAAELTRDAFVRAWQGVKSLPERRRFFPWVLRIARNLSVSLSRRRGHRLPGTRTPVLEAFGELRPDEQMALTLRVNERLPYGEIAALLEFPPGATIVKLSTARGLLLTRAGGAAGDDE
jgi:RNA polymerase sigma-70 factor (ECF subfamily)